MIPLHSVLATEGMWGQLPTLVGLVAVVVLCIAFILGFSKGFRRVGWGGLAWLTACGLFFLLSKYLLAENGLKSRTLTVLIVALIGVVVSLALYGALRLFLRPRVKWVDDDVNGDTSLAEYGLEFEPEYLDYDGEDEMKPYGKRLKKTGFGPPTFFGRLMGGVACAVNAFTILWVILSMAVALISATTLANGALGTVLQNDLVTKLMDQVQKYVFDFITIGLIILVAKRGYKRGLLDSLRAVIVTVGGFAAVVGSFYLPFSPIMNESNQISEIMNQLVSSCSQLFGNLGQFGPIVGKLVAGLFLCILAAIVMMILNTVLEKCCHMVSSSEPTRVIDGCLACVLYMIIGAVFCVFVWALLGMMDYLNVFNVGEVLGENVLSRKIFDAVYTRIDALLSPYLG